jgi:DNA-directed RNA polymerase subunit RPC12/RpoP
MSLTSVGEILEGLRGLACAHCGAGRDPRSVGLVWDSAEQGWRCVICGYRVYEGEDVASTRRVYDG